MKAWGRVLREELYGVQELFFPRYCVACGQGLSSEEQGICLSCHFFIPKTNFHIEPDNSGKRLFWGQVEVEWVLAYVYFDNASMVQDIVHAIKYEQQTALAEELGRRYARQLIGSAHPIHLFDAIIPVPISPKTLRKRGYNQSTAFATGLGSVLEIPVMDRILVRPASRSSQVGKGRTARFENLEKSFEVLAAAEVQGKRFVIVDDVLTSGATVIACTKKLLEAGAAQVGIATIARKRWSY